MAGVISGSGFALNKVGAGTLTLTGSNTYAGATTISAGTLQGDTTSLQGNIANNAYLQFNQSTNGTYSGATTISEGTLVVNTLANANAASGIEENLLSNGAKGVKAESSSFTGRSAS